MRLPGRPAARVLALAASMALTAGGAAFAEAGAGGASPDHASPDRARTAGIGTAGVSTAGVSTAGVSIARAAAQGRVRPDLITIAKVKGDAPVTSEDCEQQFSLPCYNPDQVQAAYDEGGLLGQGTNGQGKTIVIIDAYSDPTIWNDLVQFDSAFGLPNPSLKIIKVAGRVPRYNSHSADMQLWAGEITLDVEYAHAIAPGASIVLAEEPTDADAFFPDVNTTVEYVLKHHLGDVISESFGNTEQATGSAYLVDQMRTGLIEAQARHVTVVAAAGDAGSAGFELNGTDYYPYPVTSWPATDPLVTAVGGTALHLDDSGNRTSPDTVWNDTYNQAANKLVDGNNGPNPIATGGGRSVYFTRPSYQNRVKGVTGAMRGIPDISMSGACSGPVNVYQSFPGMQAGWYSVCGTSEAAPEFAGIVALADQVAGHDLGLLNPAIYELAAGQAPGIVEVTYGNNAVRYKQSGRWHSVRGYSARHGYSLVAGNGTIDAQYFVPELAKLG